MEKIRKELNSREAHQRSATNGFNQKFINSIEIERINENLNTAQQNAAVGTQLMSMNRFPKPIRWLAKLIGRIVLYFTEIITFPQRTYNQVVLQSLRDSLDLTRQIKADLSQIACDNKQLGESISKLEENITQNWMPEQEERLIERISEADTRMTDRITDQDHRITGQDHRITAQDQLRIEIKRSVSNLKTSQVFQENRLNKFLEEAGKRLPDAFSREQLETFTNGSQHRLDPQYMFFEDQLRGDRNDIMERLKIFLPLLAKTEAGKNHRPILDIGCGRGEWLELLAEHSLDASGVDINQVLIAQNSSRGFNVVESDFTEYLPDLKDNTLGAITAFHLIEHLTFDHLLLLLDESLRLLKPGGMIILETPNPENILVGSASFYLDPTHRHPLPAALTKFLAEQRGFCRVEILRLHPYTEDFRIQDEDSETAKRFNDYFYGPQDYALMGYKV